MAKKSSKKVTKQLAPEAQAKRSDSASLAEPHELNGQRQRLKKAAVGAEALKSSAPAATPDLHTTPVAASSPLAPLAALPLLFGVPVLILALGSIVAALTVASSARRDAEEERAQCRA